MDQVFATNLKLSQEQFYTKLGNWSLSSLHNNLLKTFWPDKENARPGQLYLLLLMKYILFK